MKKAVSREDMGGAGGRGGRGGRGGGGGRVSENLLLTNCSKPDSRTTISCTRNDELKSLPKKSNIVFSELDLKQEAVLSWPNL